MLVEKVGRFVEEDPLNTQSAASSVTTRLEVDLALAIGVRTTTCPVSILHYVLLNLSKLSSAVIQPDVADDNHIGLRGEPWDFPYITRVWEPAIWVDPWAAIGVDDDNESQRWVC